MPDSITQLKIKIQFQLLAQFQLHKSTSLYIMVLSYTKKEKPMRVDEYIMNTVWKDAERYFVGKHQIWVTYFPKLQRAFVEMGNAKDNLWIECLGPYHAVDEVENLLQWNDYEIDQAISG